MARKKRSSRRKKSSKPFGDYLLIIVLLLVLTAIAAGIFFLLMNKEEVFATNSADLCPERGARATVAILLDTTDEISPATKRDIQNRGRNELENLPRFYRLSMYTMSDEGLDPTPIITLCSPGQLDEMSDLAKKGITANRRMIKEKYDFFSQSINEATDQVFNKAFEGQQSPLLSALLELSLVLPQPISLQADLHPAGRNKIIYITDLMEHTDVFSSYRTGDDLKAFQDSRATEKYGKKYTENLEFWVIKRDINGLNTDSLKEFWGKILIREFKFSRSQKLKFYTLLGET